MALDAKNRILGIASRILGYLEQSPRAEDTYKGILEWWLLQQMIELDEKDVKQALRELVSRGLLVETEGLDRQVFYHLNPNRIEAATDIQHPSKREDTELES